MCARPACRTTKLYFPHNFPLILWIISGIVRISIASLLFTHTGDVLRVFFLWTVGPWLTPTWNEHPSLKNEKLLCWFLCFVGRAKISVKVSETRTSRANWRGISKYRCKSCLYKLNLSYFYMPHIIPTTTFLSILLHGMNTSIYLSIDPSQWFPTLIEPRHILKGQKVKWHTAKQNCHKKRAYICQFNTFWHLKEDHLLVFSVTISCWQRALFVIEK